MVSGLNDAQPKFKHLWGRYIHGFKPQKHCLKCFKSKIAYEITPQMKDGPYDLKDDLCDFFYLCGVGQPDSRRAGYDFAANSAPEKDSAWLLSGPCTVSPSQSRMRRQSRSSQYLM